MIESVLLLGSPVAAAVLEWAAWRAVVARKAPLLEAWLCAGAKPIEALRRAGPKVRPAMAVAAVPLGLLVIGPDAAARWKAITSLAGIALGALLALRLVGARSFVDDRLRDRLPDEAHAPFRPEPEPPDPAPRVYESRPGRGSRP